MNPLSSDKEMVEKIAQILGSKAYGTSPYTMDGFLRNPWLVIHKHFNLSYFYDNLTKGGCTFGLVAIFLDIIIMIQEVDNFRLGKKPEMYISG